MADVTTGEPHFWERMSWLWHGVFVLGIALAAITASVSHGLDEPRGQAILAIVVALTVWYAATGARALMTGKQRLGHLYVAGLLPAFVALLSIDTNMGYLMFFAIAQIYVFLDRLLYASLFCVAIFLSFFVIVFVEYPDVRSDLVPVLAQIGIPMIFSLFFGAWIHGIIRQSAQRADLIAELERTRAELATERHEAGVLAERTRLATEIHDTLAQGFTSILMLAQAAREPAAADESLALIERTARENLAEARSLVAALAPAALDGTTLPEALRRLASRHREETRTPVSVSVHGTPAPHPDTDVVLLRVAQETLANVRRHATAGTVALELRYDDGGATLLVRDDGVGFDPATLAANGGYGLRGMRHRVEQSGGTVAVSSEPGSGTTVEVTLP